MCKMHVLLPSLSVAARAAVAQWTSPIGGAAGFSQLAFSPTVLRAHLQKERLRYSLLFVSFSTSVCLAYSPSERRRAFWLFTEFLATVWYSPSSLLMCTVDVHRVYLSSGFWLRNLPSCTVAIYRVRTCTVAVYWADYRPVLWLFTEYLYPGCLLSSLSACLYSRCSPSKYLYYAY